MTDAIIDIDRVTKRYGSHTVLQDLCFSVRPGEKLALIGPSGSGKTTILRTLMMLETIESGTIRIDGENLFQMERNGRLSGVFEP